MSLQHFYSRESLQLFRKTRVKLAEANFLTSRRKRLLDYRKKKIFCELCVSAGYSKKKWRRFTDSKKEDKEEALQEDSIWVQDGGWWIRRDFLKLRYEDQEPDRCETFQQNNSNENDDEILFSCRLFSAHKISGTRLSVSHLSCHLMLTRGVVFSDPTGPIMSQL